MLTLDPSRSMRASVSGLYACTQPAVLSNNPSNSPLHDEACPLMPYSRS